MKIRGPERLEYDWDKRADARVFNSIVNNPLIGNERSFMHVRKAGTNSTWSKAVIAQPGQYYEIRLYYHNNAQEQLNESGRGIANNVRVSAACPAKVPAGKTAIIKGTISATNTDIREVWDCASLVAPEPIQLKYVKGSAVVYNEGTANGSGLDAAALLSDAGAKIAHWNDAWGIIPGGAQYAGFVVFELFAEPLEPESAAANDAVVTRGSDIASGLVDKTIEHTLHKIDQLLFDETAGKVIDAVFATATNMVEALLP